MIEFHVATIFPEIFDGFIHTGLIGKALDNRLLKINLLQLRRYATDKRASLDDTPYGGGPGMVMLAEPILRLLDKAPSAHRVLLTPQGRPFSQDTALRFSGLDSILLFCGRYEGVDERVRREFDEEISLGDFVMNGGEVAAMAIVEAVARLAPGVLGNADSATEESHRSGLLEYPQYTRPETVRGRSVPQVLLSGDHGRVAEWRRGQALLRTLERRPELFEKLTLTETDELLLDAARKERGE